MRWRCDGSSVNRVDLIDQRNCRSAKEIVLVLTTSMCWKIGDDQSTGYFLTTAAQHLVIASRSEPVLDLAFLRAKGRVVELDTDDLRFTSEEIGQFFSLAVGLQLPAETIQTLEQRTEGWATALQMAALSQRNRPDSDKLLANLEGDAHYLVDF